MGAIRCKAAWLICSLALSVAVIVTAQTPPPPEKAVLGPPVELGCSVFVSGDWDYVRNTSSVTWASSCTGMVERAKARCGGSRLNFVPTHYWADPGNGRGDPTATYQPTKYCYKFSTLWNTHGDCREPTAAEIEAYQSNMTMCFKRAVALGYDIEVTPHLDDGLGQGGWRNALDFDPAKPYGNWSYDDIMLTPLLKALGAASNENTTVYFAMTGEMSLTVVKYPSSYSNLAKAYKEPTFNGPKKLLVGVSMNFNKLYTVALTPEIVKTQNVPALEFQEMCEVMDFIGISSYSSWTTGYDFGRKELEGATQMFMAEVKYLGVDLNELVNVKGKLFHLSEYGIGGGTCGSGSCKAYTDTDVSKYPFYGMFGSYKTSNDPWLVPETRDFRYYFYNSTLRWLQTGGGPTIRVDAAFIWTLASWDFAGINPESTSIEGTYYNETICNLIREYNDEVAAYRAANTPPPPMPPSELPTEPPTEPSTDSPSRPPASVLTGPGQAGSENNQGSKNGTKVGSAGKKSSGGLSSSVIIAIAVVAGVVVCIIIGSVVYVLWKMKHQKMVPAAKNPEAPTTSPLPSTPMEIYSNPVAHQKGSGTDHTWSTHL